MSTEQANTVHEYILEHGLLAEVEIRTKAKWKGSGSRATYYNAVANAKQGIETGLVEELMLLEAEALMLEHSKIALQLEAA